MKGGLIKVRLQVNYFSHVSRSNCIGYIEYMSQIIHFKIYCLLFHEISHELTLKSYPNKMDWT